MNPNDISKKKIDLMHSIMSNKKLSKAFKEAMSSPIGSTKRTQAKTVLSIMKKISGMRYDGMGGPMSGIQNTSTNANSLPDYSNMIIFPAAPKFKVRMPTQTAQKTSPVTIPASADGKGGYLDLPAIGNGNNNLSNLNTSIFSNNSIFPNLSGISLPSTSSNSSSAFTGVTNNTTPNISYPNLSSLSTGSVSNTPSSKLNLNVGTLPMSSTSTDLSSVSLDPKAKAEAYIQNIIHPTTSIGTTPAPVNSDTPIGPANQTPTDQIKQLQDELVKAGYMTQAEVNTGYGINGPKTQAALARAQNGGTSTTGTQTGSPSSSDPAIQSAQSAVNANTGPIKYGKELADASYGGNYRTYIDKLAQDKRKEYGLDALETQLSNLKAEKGNLIPTLQTYMDGKDQYLKAIQTLIDQTEGNITNVNMADPFTAKNYNDYLNYLYTLKGRQNTRYGNFLNAATADYQADVEKLQSNYDNVYKRYTDALSMDVTLSQNDYSLLMQMGADTYTSLENAPLKYENLEALRQQNLNTRLTNLQIAGKNNSSIDQDYQKNLAAYTNQYTIDNGSNNGKPDPLNGTIDFDQLPENGLVGLAFRLESKQAFTDFIRTALVKTQKAYANEPAKLAKVQKLVDDLAAYETAVYDSSGADLEVSPSIKTPITNQILGTVGEATQTAYTSYIKSNLPEIKTAVKDLVTPSGGWFGSKKTGIEDKATWLKNHNSLDPNFLETLYNKIKLIIPQYVTSSGKDSSNLLNELFPTGTDEDAKELSKIF